MEVFELLETLNTSDSYVKDEICEDTCDTILEDIKSEEPETVVDDKSLTEHYIDEDGKLWDKQEYSENNNCTVNYIKKEEDGEPIKKSQFKYECQICGYDTRCGTDVKIHSVNCIPANFVNKKSRKKRLDLKLKDCYFPLCTFKGTDHRDLKRHLNTVHLKPRSLEKSDVTHGNDHKYDAECFECNICGITTTNKNSLKRHIHNVHLQKKNFKCHLCEFRASAKGNVDRHIDGVHLKLVNFECNSCNYSTSDRSNLKRHVEDIHLKLKNFKCAFCEYSTNDRSKCKRHENLVHLQIRKCSFEPCKFATIDKIELKRHITEVQGNDRLFECELCDYGTNENRFLLRHISFAHKNPRKQVKTSNTAAAKRNKKVVHENDRNLKCEICYTTNLKGALTRHMNVMHSVPENYGEDGTVNIPRHIRSVRVKPKKCLFCDCGGTGSEHNLKSHDNNVHVTLIS